MNFLYDTYALIEIHKGNPNYQPYVSGPISLIQLNVIELMYHFVRLQEQEEGKEYIRYLSPFVVEVPDTILWKAMELKFLKKADDLSFTDCIGYVYAQENGMRFLTGDQKFKDLPGVEYVK